MKNFEYFTPLDIGSAFRTEVDLGVFVEFIIEQLVEISRDKDVEFLPPVVYNAMGRAFNVDYNFLVNCLSKFLLEPSINGDFKIKENSKHYLRAGMYLVVGILEDYYGLARVNNSKVNLARYKASSTIDVNRRFYTQMLMKNGKNIKKYNAVSFSESVVKKLVDSQKFSMLTDVTDRYNVEQIAYGFARVAEYIKQNNVIPEPIFD
jgi:hypothetical protein